MIRCVLNKKEALQKLYTFRGADKYATFGDAQPGISNTPDDQKEIIANILDTCCKELAIEIESAKKPTKTALKEIIIHHMNEIYTARVNAENKDFGYHLCWFLAEKVGLDLWKHSTTKIWGYWDIVNKEVKIVKRVRKVVKQKAGNAMA